MWRSLFLALGLFAIILGVECLVVERATLSNRADQGVLRGALSDSNGASRDVTPPEWAPWSLISAGAVVILYSFTLPQKMKAQ